MPYRGHVENGGVVLDEPARIPEGTEVSVSVLETGRALPEDDVSLSDHDRLRSVIGKAEGLPPDFAANHDHYIHGQPKQ